MVKRLFVFIFAVISVTFSYSQNVKLDTLYYDNKGKGVSCSAFASFYCVFEQNYQEGQKQRYRGYYITGELCSDGCFLYMDKENSFKTVLDGENTVYYKNGQIKTKFYYENGIQEGEYTYYYDNGTIAEHGMVKGGLKEGLLTKFSPSGDRCEQIEMHKGKPLFNYKVVSDRKGYSSRIRLSDNSVIFESPSVEDRKYDYIKGVSREYYTKNGVMISMTCKEIKYFGKWYQISLVIANHTLSSIDFDPELITSFIQKKNKQTFPLEVWSSERYMKKVRRKQNWNSFLTELAEGLAVAGAGYSTSTTQTNTTYDGSIYANGTAYAYGTGGSAYGNFDGYGTYQGNSSTTSTTTTYNGLAAYQARVISYNRLADLEYSNIQERGIIDNGYLKKTTLYSGDAIAGYINIPHATGSVLYVYVDINGAKYKFSWDVSK